MASWIPAAEALRIATDWLDVDAARPAIIAAAHAGSIGTRARLFTVEVPNACGRKGVLEDHGIELPPEFWSADGKPPTEQDWDAGDFSTWINGNFQWQAFGVEFDQAGVLALASSKG